MKHRKAIGPNSAHQYFANLDLREVSFNSKLDAWADPTPFLAPMPHLYTLHCFVYKLSPCIGIPPSWLRSRFASSPTFLPPKKSFFANYQFFLVY